MKTTSQKIDALIGFGNAKAGPGRVVFGRRVPFESDFKGRGYLRGASVVYTAEVTYKDGVGLYVVHNGESYGQQIQGVGKTWEAAVDDLYNNLMEYGLRKYEKL